jgi:hypothetical protein
MSVEKPVKEDHSLDITGIGKLADAIPEQSWNEVVHAACSTFQQLVAPLTATTEGFGKLVTAKFDRLVDAEKVLAAENLGRASEKVRRSQKKAKNKPKASVIVKLIQESSTETDSTLRELWTNLLANEIIDGTVHPEFVRILARLAPGDAHRLAAIANPASESFITLFFRSLIGHSDFAALTAERMEFVEAHLQHVGLIHRVEGTWKLTITGRAFIKAVSDPSLEQE